MNTRSDELEDFKTTINLSQYAAAQGYTLDPKSSSRNSAVMVDTAGDKIIIAKGHDRHWVYFSAHSPTKRDVLIPIHLSALQMGRLRLIWVNQQSHQMTLNRYTGSNIHFM